MVVHIFKKKKYLQLKEFFLDPILKQKTRIVIRSENQTRKQKFTVPDPELPGHMCQFQNRTRNRQMTSVSFRTGPETARLTQSVLDPNQEPPEHLSQFQIRNRNRHELGPCINVGLTNEQKDNTGLGEKYLVYFNDVKCFFLQFIHAFLLSIM